MLKRYVIIVAAGKGSRMQAPVPKQFLRLAGKPVLLHSILAFHQFDPMAKIILVLPGDQLQQWEKLVKEFDVLIPCEITGGGDTRFESVKNGLALIPENENAIVAIHDAVRPLVAQKTISASFKAAERYGNAVPAIPLNDSIRQIESSRSVAVDRSKYCLIQTPQCFEVGLLKKAYAQEYKFTFTDDAGVIEALGEQIHLVDGNPDNFKLTTPTDLVLAEAILKMRSQFVPDVSGGTHP
ncbi:MAG TPA: 2-C-methyl-D-erythritol 4-phosphate cytidylyltransferase [Bacteroidia bacterium]|nr:2-C-methyl-D-erythritol 4-phosphate cytidylyltransferase [Bacteroidia bacterium]